MNTDELELSPHAKENLPTHVAIIMDGNGRWANQRSLPRIEGHRVGAESVKAVVRAAGEVGIRYLTLYAFSAENWNRPEDEVGVLMQLLSEYLQSDAEELDRHNVHLDVIGHIHRLPRYVQDPLKKTIATLAENTGLQLVVALSYGARTEIADAARSIARKVKAGTLQPEDVDEELVAQHLYTSRMPDPELLIRTSGEMRISNFLLWQISYAEFVVTSTLWPDFREADFLEALEEYAGRHRRFGGVTAK